MYFIIFLLKGKLFTRFYIPWFKYSFESITLFSLFYFINFGYHWVDLLWQKNGKWVAINTTDKNITG